MAQVDLASFQKKTFLDLRQAVPGTANSAVNLEGKNVKIAETETILNHGSPVLIFLPDLANLRKIEKLFFFSFFLFLFFFPSPFFKT